MGGQIRVEENPGSQPKFSLPSPHCSPREPRHLPLPPGGWNPGIWVVPLGLQGASSVLFFFFGSDFRAGSSSSDSREG